MVQYFKNVALDQPPNQDERYRKCHQWRGNRRKGEAGNHDSGL